MASIDISREIDYIGATTNLGDVSVIRPEIAVQINKLRAEAGMPPLDPAKVESVSPFQYKPPVSRAVAIAGLFILGASYGQLMGMFGVSQSTVYDAVSRHVPPALRELRPRGRGKSRIPFELASTYLEAVSRAGRHTSAVTLAAAVQQLAEPDTLEPESRVGP